MNPQDAPLQQVLTLPGAVALSPFRIEKLRAALPAVDGLALDARFMHFVAISAALSAEEMRVLDRLLTYGTRPPAEPQGAMLLVLWLVAGAYFVLSWRRGGQTMGMRPWRLRVVDAAGARASTAALWTRYAVATLALACAGLGFWWSLVDRDRRTWHDLASRTCLVRVAKA